MSIIKTTLPKNSLLHLDYKTYDFVDSYQSKLNDAGNAITTVDIGRAFFSGGPEWIGKLFALRNKIVGLFGLKTPGETENRDEQLANFKCEKGERLGLFQVFDRTENEVILGEDDKHLNFRISLYLSEIRDGDSTRNLTISTTVVFHNWWGRLYFMPVRPFHKLIVPSMLKQSIRALEQHETFALAKQS